MPNYKNAECVICGKRFNESDDIVVCPDCGTPYHRECYAAAGRCVADGLHSENKSWHELQNDNTEDNICPNCGHVNKRSEDTCGSCGKYIGKMSDEQQEQANPAETRAEQLNSFFRSTSRLNPEEDFDGVKLRSLDAFVGKSKAYYLPIFKIMKDFKKKISLSFSALWIPTFYFAYRKMYFWAFISFLRDTLFALPNLLLTIATPEYGYYEYFSDKLPNMSRISEIVESGWFTRLLNISSVVSTLMMIFFALFGNYLYYRHCIRKIKAIGRQTDGDMNTSDAADEKELLAKRGGTSVIALVNSFSLYIIFGFLITFFLPKI